MLPFRERQYRRDIYLYVDSFCVGFHKLETIEEFFDEYSRNAEKLAEDISDSSVILYAIMDYDEQVFVSANFMLLEMPYHLYLETVHRLLSETRVFFVRGRKEYNDQS